MYADPANWSLSQRLTALCNAVESCGAALTRVGGGADCVQERGTEEERVKELTPITYLVFHCSS